MSGQDESANSRFLGHSLRKSKDAQFDEAALRAPLLSPKKIHGLSDDDDVNVSFSNTSTAQGTRLFFTTTTTLDGAWKKQVVSKERIIPSKLEKYIAIQCNNRSNCGKQQRGFLYMVFDARPVPVNTNWTSKTSLPPPHSSSKWKLVLIHKYTEKHFIGFFINKLGLFDQSMPFQLNFDDLEELRPVQKHLYFIPINLYSSEKGALKHMDRLATVDASGFLSADTNGPTIIIYKLSSTKHPSPQSTTTTTTKKRKRRNTRGKNKKISSSVSKLKQPTINFYINSDVSSSYQRSIDCKSKDNNCIVYPSSQSSNPHELYPNLFVSERKYYVLSKKTIQSLHHSMHIEHKPLLQPAVVVSLLEGDQLKLDLLPYSV